MRSEVSSQAVKHKDVESENIREDFEPFVLEVRYHLTVIKLIQAYKDHA